MTEPGRKLCPYCAEEIAEAAKRCKWCDSWLSGRGPGDAITWVGQDLIVRGGMSLAAEQCLLCGGGAGVQRWSKRFTYTPPWVYFGLLLGLLPAAILSAIATKRETLELSRCAACKSSMTWKAVFGWVFGLGGLFGFPILGSVIGSMVEKKDGAGMGVAFGFLAWLVALIVIAIANSMNAIKCRLIADGNVTLKFPRPEITQSVIEGCGR